MRTVQTRWALPLIAAWVALLAMPAAAQLRPDLAEEEKAIDQRLQAVLFELRQPAEVFAIPETAKVLRPWLTPWSLSTDGRAALERWARAPGHVTWVASGSVQVFLPNVEQAAGPGWTYDGSGRAVGSLGVASPGTAGDRELLEGVQASAQFQEPGLAQLPPDAVVLLTWGGATYCAYWPYGEGTIVFFPGPPNGLLLDMLDGPRLWFNFRKWLLSLVGEEAAAAGGVTEAAALPKVEADAAGCITCPHCGQRMRVGTTPPAASQAAQPHEPPGLGPGRAAWGEW